MNATVAILAALGRLLLADDPARITNAFRIDPSWTLDEGGITRGDRTRRELALIFTGSERQDKMHAHLKQLIDELRNRKYDFRRVDRLLSRSPRDDE